MEENINNVNVENQENEKKPGICHSCGEKLAEGNLFCPKCGTKVQDKEKITTAVTSTMKKSGLKIDKKYIAIIIVAVIFIAIFGKIIGTFAETSKLTKAFDNYISSSDYETAVKYLNRNSDNENFIAKAEKKVVKLYKNHIKKGEYEKAAEIFNGIISETYHISFDTTEDIIEDVLKDIESLQEDFADEKKTLEEIKPALDSYATFDEERIKTKATEVLENADKLDGSRIGYVEGNSYYKDKDYGNAIKSYLKVVEIDKNYKDAQKKIEKIKDTYKKEVFDTLDSLLTAHKYDEALDNLNTLKEVCDDPEVDAKLNIVNQAKEKYKKEEAEKSQKVVVSNIRVYNPNRFISDMAAEVIITNNSDKVIKNANIVIASFDSNGYAVNIKYPTLYGAEYDHMLRGSMSTINLLPGESHGKNRYYDGLSSRAEKAHAIVAKVEFTDGTTWENPYYDYWVSENKDTYQ